MYKVAFGLFNGVKSVCFSLTRDSASGNKSASYGELGGTNFSLHFVFCIFVKYKILFSPSFYSPNYVVRQKIEKAHKSYSITKTRCDFSGAEFHVA